MKLTPGQQVDVDRARAFLTAAKDPDRDVLRRHLDEPTGGDPDWLRATALGAARAHMDGLLKVIEQLTGGQS